MNIQIFGTNKSADTRKAIRFFKERRIAFHFRDVSEKGPSRGELENIAGSVDRDELIDTEGGAYKRGGYEASVSFYGETLGQVIVEGALKGVSKIPVVENSR